ALSYAVASVDHEEIDKINILKASLKAMHLALDKLKKRPKFLLIDGNRFIKYRRTPHACIIQGDATYASIAAASILAKTYRDDYMLHLHKTYPHYKWKFNKGYATADHRKAIETHGLSPFHRKTFHSCSMQLEFELEELGIDYHVSSMNYELAQSPEVYNLTPFTESSIITPTESPN
ncbi:MAG TPA: ribonuclease HII, partial [Flavitalea sp.]|nr:ribonuclease HII [Flavitalea sp.]